MKKIISILIVFIILISTVLTAPVHALAVEIIGGTYVTYAILAAALAAAGYTIASSQLDEATFQAILDSAGAEDIKAMITATQIYTTVNGRVFFNWSSSQWFRFVTWVNSYVATGSLVIPGSGAVILEGSLFDPTVISNYAETFIRTSNNSFGAQVGNCTLVTQSKSSGVSLRLNLEQNVYFSMANSYWNSVPPVVFVSPFLYQYSTNTGYSIVVGQGMNSDDGLAQTINDVAYVVQSKLFAITADQLYINGERYLLSYSNGNVRVQKARTNTYITIAPTVNYTTSYTSLIQYLTDVINSGALVGDWSGIGDDVINPSYPDTDVEIGIDAYPNWRVGTGIDAIPDSIDDGASIDIPLNPYIETDLGPDVIDPYVDFTPWDTTTVPPDDVIPDTRINPPGDVTANPDTPWADDQTYPLDYPTDTVTDDLPPGNNPNPDPSSDDKTNRLKLGPLLLSKFPFCLPWDLQHALKVLIAPAEAPVFTIPFVNSRLGINETLTIDLSFADRLAQVTRWFLSALWVVILILITSKIIWK